MGPLRYPLSGESPVKTVALGVTLAALGLLVVPALAVTGYYGRVLARSSRGDPAPTFEGVRDLLVDGARTWLAVAAYLAGGVVLLLLFTVAALALGAANTGFGAEVGTLALAMLALLALGLFAFPTWYFAPAALTELARERRVGAAFDPGSIRRVVFDRRYFVRWLAGCGLLVVGSAVYYALVFADLGVPLVGHVVGVAVNFYCQTAAFHWFGRGYAAATGDATTADEESRVARGDDRRVAHGDDRDVPWDADREQSDEWGADAERWRERRRRER